MDELIQKLMDKQKKEWESIQDIIGPANEWPKWIAELFLGSNLTHAQRPLVCAFAVFNGLNPVVNFYILHFARTSKLLLENLEGFPHAMIL